jgi:hypothetical protein
VPSQLSDSASLTLTKRRRECKLYIDFFLICNQLRPTMYRYSRIILKQFLLIEILGYRHIGVGTHILDSGVESMSSWTSRGESADVGHQRCNYQRCSKSTSNIKHRDHFVACKLPGPERLRSGMEIPLRGCSMGGGGKL